MQIFGMIRQQWEGAVEELPRNFLKDEVSSKKAPDF
jgi:hypothetical protein